MTAPASPEPEPAYTIEECLMLVEAGGVNMPAGSEVQRARLAISVAATEKETEDGK